MFFPMIVFNIGNQLQPEELYNSVIDHSIFGNHASYNQHHTSFIIKTLLFAGGKISIGEPLTMHTTLLDVLTALHIHNKNRQEHENFLQYIR